MADMTITGRDRLVLGWLVLNGNDGTKNVARDLGLTEDEVEESAIRLAAAGRLRMHWVGRCDNELETVGG